MEIPTVRVTHPELEGGMLINETDFDPAVHKPADEASAIRCEALADALAVKAALAEGGTPISLEDLKAELGLGEGGAQTSATDPVDPAVAPQARRAELEALSFVELKEKVADLGVPIVPVGTSKVELVEQVLHLEAAAAAALGAQS